MLKMGKKTRKYSITTDLTQIQTKPKRSDFSLPPEWWDRSEGIKLPILALKEDVEATIVISKVGKRFEVRGSFTTVLQLQCDRCLEPFASPLDLEFSLILERLPQEVEAEEEYELAPEEMGVDFIRGDEVELTDMIKEQIYLSLPMKALCRESCLGLCVSCGANLNKDRCDCKATTGHPAFQKLRSLHL